MISTVRVRLPSYTQTTSRSPTPCVPELETGDKVWLQERQVTRIVDALILVPMPIRPILRT